MPRGLTGPPAEQRAVRDATQFGDRSYLTLSLLAERNKAPRSSGRHSRRGQRRAIWRDGRELAPCIEANSSRVQRPARQEPKDSAAGNQRQQGLECNHHELAHHQVHRR